MRSILCLILALALICSLAVCSAGGAQPASQRTSAWWGLLFPALFDETDTPVTFTWPVVNYVLSLFRANA